MEGRNFYKCPICLSVVCVDGPMEVPTCSLCNHRMWHMGQVKGQKLVNRELLTPCDSRCTNAEGPNCDCQCLGKNHGSHALVQVERAAGGIPRVTPPDLKAAERRREFLQARDEAASRIKKELGPDIFERFKAGQWIDDRDAWENASHLFDEYRSATALKSHKGRLKALGGIAAPRLSR